MISAIFIIFLAWIICVACIYSLEAEEDKNTDEQRKPPQNDA